MILNDPEVTAVLQAVFETAGRVVGSIVRIVDVENVMGIDPAVVKAAVSELIDANLLMLGSTNDRVCLSAAGAACIRDHLSVKHFNDIERLAIVGESRWENLMASFCTPFTTATIRYFPSEKSAEARKWIATT